MMMCTNDLRYYICKLFWWGQRKQSGQAVLEEAVIINSPLGHSITLWMWRIRLHYHLHLKKILKKKLSLVLPSHVNRKQRNLLNKDKVLGVCKKRTSKNLVSQLGKKWWNLNQKHFKKKWELFCATWVHWMKKYWVGNNILTHWFNNN